MAIKKAQQGFALLMAVIFMSVMLAFALTIGALGYKQSVLSSSAVESQYAFYAADAALECVLYADQANDTFSPAAPPITVTYNCDGQVISARVLDIGLGTGPLVSRSQIDLDGKWCAEITTYKYSTPPSPSSNDTTFIFSQGYSVPCAALSTSNRYSARGLQAHY